MNSFTICQKLPSGKKVRKYFSVVWQDRSEDRIPLLLRKEVIQPHLPVRLPCYDLALLTDLTLVVFLPCGLDQRLWVLSTQVA